MNFYDVLADGYHTPLTKIQITELFHAGRLTRSHPCKRVERKEWRTIDELFPLLKYDSSGPSVYENRAQPASSARARLIFLLTTGAIALLALLYFFGRSSNKEFESGPFDTISPQRVRRVESVSPTTYPTPESMISNTTPSRADLLRPYQQPNSAPFPPAPTYESQRQSLDAQQSRFVRERANAEQRQLEGQRAQDRANAERSELTRQKDAGQNVIAPLDQSFVLQNVGGADVNLKIHDNDVTSFDIWVNGSLRREVPKQKGISGSRTDETLIYSNGRAKLYYVWEISGTLNHCLLRVRED